MKKLKIALLQIAPVGSLQDNLNKGITACIKAHQKGADIALFPEMWSNGYNIYDRSDDWTKDAIPEHSNFVNTFATLANELEMAIGITYLEECETGPKNSFLLIDRHGEKVLSYSKIHTCDFSEEKALTQGDDFWVCTLDTRVGNINVGAMICYDREFPESARILMLKGAELVLVPNACPMEINRISQLRARAYENMMAIATCNYPEAVPDCNGHSTIFDGVAYLSELEGSRDTCILETDGEEGVFVAEFDVEMLREYRKTEVHGNAFRRPSKYSLLVGKRIDNPFKRKEYRG